MVEKAEIDHKDCQAVEIMVDHCIQTERLGIDMACGKDRDFRLKSKYV